MARVLIVDDEANMRRILSSVLRKKDHEVVEADGVQAAREALAGELFDLVITDQRMPGGDGLEVIADCRDIDPSLPVVMLTAYATVDLAVDAMQAGAFDFISKPFDPDRVEAVVQRAAERSALLRENSRLRQQVARANHREDLIGESPVMQRLRTMISRVGPTHATVLITGETGTGKELVARALQKASPRANQPFIAVNCAAFTESLLDSELFGHEKGAFTGADRPRQGVFEAAHRGTLFLDEAGEMSLPLQAKLLRVVMNGEVVRVGSTSPRKVDVRILVATHRDLQQRVANGRFREDLYYRLAVVPIHVPPLRERLQDLPAIADHLLVQVARELKMPVRALTENAKRRLSHYTYPGNVRELRNLIERAMILSQGDSITDADLPDLGDRPHDLLSGEASEKDWIEALPESIDLRATITALERRLVERALAGADGVQAEAARRLAVSRSDLSYKLRKLELDATAFRSDATED